LPIVEKYIAQLFKRKGIGTTTEREFWKVVFNNLNSAIDEGYKSDVSYDTTDFEMLSNLKLNAASFAAFKNHTFKNELVKLLINSDGDIRDWSSFKNEAVKLNEKFNFRHLKSEYDHAVASSNMAAKWQDFQKRKHLYPNLKYVAIIDSRTRELHKKWNGIVLPIDHKFWQTHYPPNDWGCRCDVLQTDEEEDTKKTEVNDLPNLPKQFNNNSGITGNIFDKNHPYFESSDKNIIKQDVEAYKLKFPNYIYLKDVNVKVSAWADRSGLLSDIEVASFLNKNKYKVTIEPIANPMFIQGVKMPEYKVDGKIADRKSPSKISFKNVLKSANAQNCEVVVIDLTDYPYDFEFAKNRIALSFKEVKSYSNIKKVIIVNKDKTKLFEYNRSVK